MRRAIVTCVLLALLSVACGNGAGGSSSSGEAGDTTTTAKSSATSDVTTTTREADPADVTTTTGGTGGDQGAVDPAALDFGDWQPERSGALIFLWHRAGVPHEPGSFTPSTPWGDGFYESNSEQTASYHLDLLEEAGANLMLLSWWGTADDGFSSHIDRAADVYVQEATERSMTWAVFWEATNPRDLDDDLERIREWSRTPTYMRNDSGEPVLFIYNRAWREIDPETLEELANEFQIYLEKFPRISAIPSGEGWTYWDVPWTSEEELRSKYSEVSSREDLAFAAFAMAGLDNTGIRSKDGRPATVWPDEGPSGEWLLEQARFVSEFEPDVVLTPLNELGEHSAVEPTVEQGRSVFEAWKLMNSVLMGD